MKRSATTAGGESLQFQLKLLVMISLIVLDIGFNSSVEHDTIKIHKGEEDGASLLLMLGLQLVVQVGVFVILFLIMFETYPLRVGLTGTLTSKYLAVYAINVIYFLMTATVYGYRVNSMTKDLEMKVWEVWDLSGYLPLSILHKIAATVYYVTNIRAALTLGDPMFYSKQAWVGMYFDHQGGEVAGGDGGGGGGGGRSFTLLAGT